MKHSLILQKKNKQTNKQIKHHWIKGNWDAKPKFSCALAHHVFEGLAPSSIYMLYT